MAGELGPDAGAAAYESDLGEAFGEGGPPELDLLLLGLGPDGHCASLFPNQDSLEESDRPVIGVERPGMAPLVARITLTLPVLNAAREVVFLVSGAEKADAVARAFDGDPDPSVPASLVAPHSGALTVVMDPAAAGELAEAG
jgi:6-phosphogluconolactonase